MSKIQPYFDEYASYHQNKTNEWIHWICVPAILMSLLGLLMSIPVPTYYFAKGDVTINWIVLPPLAAFIYYRRLSRIIALSMLVIMYLMILFNARILQHYIPLPLWATSIIIFVVAWIGQFIGHKIEGKKPKFLEDLQYLLIGPAWLLSLIYKKMGIRY